MAVLSDESLCQSPWLGYTESNHPAEMLYDQLQHLCYMINLIINIIFCNLHNTSALTLLVGRQEGYLACKKTGCWFVGDDDLTEDCSSYSCSCHRHLHHI